MLDCLVQVNASGQFCGVAEIVGPVDFNKDMNFWQQDKWSGSFPVKWHIIKDVPNTNFRHIILENNENKPVTNSRDTQEVCPPVGFTALAFFRKYFECGSILWLELHSVFSWTSYNIWLHPFKWFVLFSIVCSILVGLCYPRCDEHTESFGLGMNKPSLL